MVSAPPLVTIPGCSAIHLLGDQQIPLANDAELALVEVYGDSSTPPLTITFGDSLAFPLDEETLLGTQTGNGNIYLLRPHLKDVQGPQGWIRIEMPDGVEEEGTDLGAKRDEWERLLVQHGYLLGNSVRAGGDEIAAGLKEAGHGAVDSIKQQVESYKASHAPSDAPTTFSRTTHARARQVNSATQTAANFATSAAAVIGGLSHAVGETIGKTFHIGQKTEHEKSEARKTVEEVGRAFGDVSEQFSIGQADIGSAAKQGMGDVVTHSYGEDVGKLSAQAGGAAGNVGVVAGAGLLGTSATFHAAQAAKGVTDADLAAAQSRAPQ